MPQPILPEVNSALLTSWQARIRFLTQALESPRNRPMLTVMIWNERIRYLKLFTEGKKFYEDLNDRPLERISYLDLLLDEKITAFEYLYPAGQSLLVRTALQQLSLSRRNINTLTFMRDDLIHRNCYLQYCGLLASVYKQLEQGNDKLDKLLKAKILEVLEKTYVKFDGDLPDELAFGVNASEHFARTHDIVSADVLVTTEETHFNTASRHLNQTLQTHRGISVNEEVKTIARAIYADLTQVSLSSTPDKKFAANVMRAMDSFIKSPDDNNKQQEFLRFINHAQGKPSLYKKMAGLFLAVIGISLMAVGIALGVTLIGTFYSIHVVAAGFAIAFEGASLFHQGRRHGTSKLMLGLFDRRNTISPILPTQSVEPLPVVPRNEPIRPFTGTAFKL